MIETLQEVAYFILYMWNEGGFSAKILLIIDLMGILYFIVWSAIYAYYKVYKHEDVPTIIVNVD